MTDSPPHQGADVLDEMNDPWGHLPRVRRASELDTFGRPTEQVRDKVLTELLDVHVEWVRAARLVFVATSSGSGACDVSPKGDPAGLVHVLDSRTLILPERAGNHRMDGFRNILDNPHAGLLIIIPGRPETLRVNGSARIITEAPFFDDMVVKGHRPSLALLLRVEEVFFHCPKALVRSGAWRPRSWNSKGVRSYAEIAHALWRSDSSLAEVRAHYRRGEPTEAEPMPPPPQRPVAIATVQLPRG